MKNKIKNNRFDKISVAHSIGARVCMEIKPYLPLLTPEDLLGTIGYFVADTVLKSFEPTYWLNPIKVSYFDQNNTIDYGKFEAVSMALLAKEVAALKEEMKNIHKGKKKNKVKTPKSRALRKKRPLKK